MIPFVVCAIYFLSTTIPCICGAESTEKVLPICSATVYRRGCLLGDYIWYKEISQSPQHAWCMVEAVTGSKGAQFVFKEACKELHNDFTIYPERQLATLCTSLERRLMNSPYHEEAVAIALGLIYQSQCYLAWVGDVRFLFVRRNVLTCYSNPMKQYLGDACIKKNRTLLRCGCRSLEPGDSIITISREMARVLLPHDLNKIIREHDLQKILSKECYEKFSYYIAAGPNELQYESGIEPFKSLAHVFSKHALARQAVRNLAVMIMNYDGQSIKP